MTKDIIKESKECSTLKVAKEMQNDFEVNFRNELGVNEEY